MFQVWLKSLDIYSSYRPETKIWAYLRQITPSKFDEICPLAKKGKKKVQGVPQSQTAALPRHEEEEETDKSKQAPIEQTYKKH